MSPIAEPPATPSNSTDAPESPLDAGLCHVDLDNMEQVAVALGEEAAGIVLTVTQELLSQTFDAGRVSRRGDFHGFRIALPPGTHAQSLTLIDRALDSICAGRDMPGLPLTRALSTTTPLAGWPVTARAGIVWAEDAPDVGADEMGRRAAAASAAARAQGLGRCAFGPASAGAELRARLICDLPRAMEHDRLKIFGQEIRRLHPTDDPRRQYEILIQFTDCAGHHHPPSEFVMQAEQSALIETLDRWVIAKTLIGHADMLHARPEICLSLNLSGRSLGQAATWPFLAQVLAESRIAPDRIQLEITETSRIGDLEQAAANVRAARAAGISVALDDFGTGLSGFDYLTAFDVNCIKIDGALITKVADLASTEAEILRSLTGLAQRLGLEVVAEHVSSPEILAALTGFAVCKVQGFEIGKPRPLTEILERH